MLQMLQPIVKNLCLSTVLARIIELKMFISPSIRAKTCTGDVYIFNNIICYNDHQYQLGQVKRKVINQFKTNTSSKFC